MAEKRASETRKEDTYNKNTGCNKYGQRTGITPEEFQELRRETKETKDREAKAINEANSKVTVGNCPKCRRDLRVKQKVVKPAMHLTCKCGWSGWIGKDDSVRSKHNESFFKACDNNRIDEVENMLDMNENFVNAKNEYGRTPLHVALMGRHIKLAEILVKNGANINTKDDDGDTPLHIALMEKHIEFAENLINNGVDIDTANNRLWTPLHIATYNGWLELVKRLISKGANVNSKDESENTPLHKASKEGHIETVKILIDNGANVNATDNIQWTPLHKAVNNEYYELVELLMNNGADVNSENKFGVTPLHSASKTANTEIIKLLSSGDAKIKNKKLYDAQNGHNYCGLCGRERPSGLKPGTMMIMSGALLNDQILSSFHLCERCGSSFCCYCSIDMKWKCLKCKGNIFK